MMRKNLEALEAEYEKSKLKVRDLEKKLSAYQNSDRKDEFITADHVASVKIVDLCKKLREKTAELESLKTKYSKLEKRFFDIKYDIPEKEAKVLPMVIDSQIKEDQVKKLQDKLNSLMGKFAETKNMNMQLKNDLKLANKWLQQEIGENFESLQSLNNSNSNWRGRSQIIFDLQQKNIELREKLKNVQGKVSGFSLDTMCTSLCKADSKISTLSKDYDDLKLKYDDMKRKSEALKARCRVLDSDLILSKSKLSIQKEQSIRDQDLIDTLTAQISSHKAITTDDIQQKNTIKKLQNEKDQLIKQTEEYRGLIKKLKEEIEELKKSRHADIKLSNSGNNLLTELPVKNKDEIVDKFNQEKLQLVNMLESLNLRLKSERDAHIKTQLALKVEKQKAAKAEAIASIELSSCRSGYSTFSNAKSSDMTLKNQLELAEENIKALQTRLDIETFERKSDLLEFTKILQNYDFRK